VAAQAQDADGEVAQAGHGPRGGVGADLAGVLGEGDIADVMQRLDAPVPFELVVERGLVGLHDQQVGGVLWVTSQSACSRWVWSASTVTTAAARSRRSSSGRNRAI
jgi:hypothetical protein